MNESKFTCMREGLTIRGIECRPNDRKEKLQPVIISHGFMANHESVLHYTRKFAEWGYAAYCFDFCGGCMIGSSDGKNEDMSVLTETKDLLSVIDYVKGLPYTDPTRLLLMGCSQGGFVSAMTAAQLKTDITALILFFPALCIPDDARAGQMMDAKFDPHNIPETIPCGPITLGRIYPTDVMEMDAFTEIAGYDGPVLIVHGTGDSIVSYSYAERALEVYKQGDSSASENKKLVLLEDAPHGFDGEDDQKAIIAIQEFLTQQG